MITEKELKEYYSEFSEMFDNVYGALEALWQTSHKKYPEFAKEVERIEVGSNMLLECRARVRNMIDEMSEIARINEMQKMLPNLVDALDTIARVKGSVDRFYEKRKEIINK